MAINISNLIVKREKDKAAEALAKQLADEQKEESGWGSFLSFAAPLAASILLPGIGTAAMGLLGGGALGSLGVGAAGAISGGGLLGGLLSGAGTALGTYGISQGIDEMGRTVGFGGEVEDIDMSDYAWASDKDEKEGKTLLQDLIDASDEGQVTSALTAGALGGFKTMGGIDAIKAKSKEFGASFFKGDEFVNPSATGLGMERAVGDIGIGTVPTQSIGSTFATDPLQYQSSIGGEGSPLNFLTGEKILGEGGESWLGAEYNLLDNLPQYEGSILNDLSNQYGSSYMPFEGLNEYGLTPEQLRLLADEQKEEIGR